MCAVCGQFADSIESCTVSAGSACKRESDPTLGVNIGLLKVPEGYPASADFVSDIVAVSGLMLENLAVDTHHGDGQARVQVCKRCWASLNLGKIPRFPLANKLYRGRLPNESSDLTWVEEMVCAIYKNTAHIMRLYGSTDPSQPKVIHGNTCAHEMNIISTVNVLPRTPANINSLSPGF